MVKLTNILAYNSNFKNGPYYGPWTVLRSRDRNTVQNWIFWRGRPEKLEFFENQIFFKGKSDFPLVIFEIFPEKIFFHFQNLFFVVEKNELRKIELSFQCRILRADCFRLVRFSERFRHSAARQMNLKFYV